LYIIKRFDPWGNPLCTCPPKYTFNPITGCGHKCKYCYITSYIKDAFHPRVKNNLIYLVEKDLRRLPPNSIVAISYSSDPYSPPEDKERNMRLILNLMKAYNMNVLIATKSNLVTRDIDIISDMNCVVSVTITTLDGSLANILETDSPSPKDRINAIEKLVDCGIPVSLRIDPIIPYVNDDLISLRELVELSSSLNIKHIVSSIYKMKPDSFKRLIEAFPEYKVKLRRLYIDSGEYKYGYRYAETKYRKRVLHLVKDLVDRYNSLAGFNVCREEFIYLNSSSCFCDAQHLLKNYIEIGKS
jgi:DNA repair photolyase